MLAVSTPAAAAPGSLIVEPDSTKTCARTSQVSLLDVTALLIDTSIALFDSSLKKNPVSALTEPVTLMRAVNYIFRTSEIIFEEAMESN